MCLRFLIPWRTEQLIGRNHWFLGVWDVRPVIQIKISRFTFLEKRRSRDFFTHTNQKSLEKNLEKKNLKIFGGHLAKFFCEVNLEIFLEIYVLSYTAVNLEIFSIKKSRDILSLFLWSLFLIIFGIMNHDVDDDNKNKRHRLLLAAVAASFFSFF